MADYRSEQLSGIKWLFNAARIGKAAVVEGDNPNSPTTARPLLAQIRGVQLRTGRAALVYINQDQGTRWSS